jgi:midasin
MEVLWAIFQPKKILNVAALVRARELESLASRFDAIKWRVKASIPELSAAMSALTTAFAIIRAGEANTAQLLKDLATEIQSLETRIGHNYAETQPFLAQEFELLRQALLLQSLPVAEGLSASQRDLPILSNQSTISQMRSKVVDGMASLLHSVEDLMCQESSTHIWDGKLTASLFGKLRRLNSTCLSDLRLLEVELPAMGRYMTDSSPSITADPVLSLNSLLWQLMEAIASAHSDGLRDNFQSVKERSRSAVKESAMPASEADLRRIISSLPDIDAHHGPEHVSQVFQHHFSLAILALDASMSKSPNGRQFSSVAWVQFAIACIKLYVPDKVFDPQLRSQLEREFDEELITTLRNKQSALVAFEEQFTGQKSSLRSRLIEEELNELSPLPTKQQAVYRPAQSKLGQVQAEFSNVLKAVLQSDVSSSHFHLLSSSSTTAAGEVKLIQENIGRLIQRFYGHFEAYQDMTWPMINILRCLQLGLSLSSGPFGQEEMNIGTPMDAIPFLGGKLWASEEHMLSTKNLEFLSFVGLLVAVDGLKAVNELTRQSVFECFHNYHQEWTKQLEADRAAEQSRQSLYRFKGSLEDEEEVDEEEFNDLFPTYEDGTGKALTEHDKVRNLSIKLAHAHKMIFLAPKDPLSSMRELCKAVGQSAGDEIIGNDRGDQDKNTRLLPGVMLFLDERLSVLKETAIPPMYNFYADSNLPEVRKLVVLVNNIQNRFRELNAVDEIGYIQTLDDILGACDRLLETVLSEPLAKTITKVEQLHAAVYEWEFRGLVSQTYRSPALYDALTSTIVSWRRLELSTWAKLFNLEISKCEEDANSWWFVAYQATVAIPLSMANDEEKLKAYSVELVKDLEQYFSTTIVGQYTTRLSLLTQLREHVCLLSLDFPALSTIHNTLANFVSLYQRYRAPVEDAINAGRAPIERKMKDVLLMASWKDTNINALRESAKKSHLKLFRIVRKFRAVLGQSMRSIIERGLPDEGHKLYKGSLILREPTASVPESSTMWVKETMPDWLTKHKRLANISTTISIMSKAGRLPEGASSLPRALDSFVESLTSSMLELKKETPSLLNEENEKLVKHLKTRKRKLLADTLQELKRMGLRSNHSQDRLGKQISLSVILASRPSMPAGAGSSSEAASYFFHKMLDIAPKIRASAQTHSEDLTGPEIARGIGYFEGMLYTVLAQRDILASSFDQVSMLKGAVAQIHGLGTFEDAIYIQNNHRFSNWTRVLRWLIHILGFGLELLSIHGRLGSTDSSRVQSRLRGSLEKLRVLQGEHDGLKTIPSYVTTARHSQLEDDFCHQLKSLSVDLTEMAQSQPEIAFILRQILQWTIVTVRDNDEQVDGRSVTAFRNQLSTLCDSVLVAVQQFDASASKLASSSDAAIDWLVVYSHGVSSALRALHIQNIYKAVHRLIQDLSGLQLGDLSVSKTATAHLSMVRPILEQYLRICEQNLSMAMELHCSTAHMAYRLGKHFTEIASQGFCLPQEKSDEKSGEAGKAESGTGLGDGDGAEDISKDIQTDEDLSELAQEANKEQNDDIEDEKDAVDMAGEEMEGELGSVDGAEEEDNNEKEGEEENGDEMDEEAGDVDDLDPTAVDEKMWDGDREEAEKDQKGEKPAGEQQNDQTAADSNAQQDSTETKEQDGEDGEAGQEDEPEAQEEDVQVQEELNRQDQHVEQNETLDLPDEMNLDIDDESQLSDDEDLDMATEGGGSVRGDKEDDVQSGDDGEEQLEDGADQDQDVKQDDTATDEKYHQGDEEQLGIDEDLRDPEPGPDPESNVDDAAQRPQDEASTAAEETAPSDVKTAGQGQDQDANQMDVDDNFDSKAADQDQGNEGDGAPDQETGFGNKGSLAQSTKAAENPESPEDESKEIRERDPFKKLGDALERWHSQNSEIKDSDDQPKASKEERSVIDAESTYQEFQHLQDELAEADTQAMGGAADEDARPVDDSMAIDEEIEDPTSRLLPDAGEDENIGQIDDAGAPESNEAADNKSLEKEDGRSGVSTRQGAYNREQPPPQNGMAAAEEEEETVQEASSQLFATHISDEPRRLIGFNQAMQLWTALQTKTHPLSLSLTSQLRLILTPSQSTKISGSYRTGKRLNIKKIIPYIASSYKRDKIWMRRSIPTKRSYQILLCVDDSKSMGEAKSGLLALESLVMVSRALTMLEVGQVGVLGFGADVFMAHDFTEPFASHDAGAKVLQHFFFEQEHTDIRLLVRNIISRFQAARLQNTSRGSEDLWQLALILSDGITPSAAHDDIRRLLREAMEERIMIVFIVMDDVSKTKGDSVLDLKEAKFVKDGEGLTQVVIERYLDSFPFQYYLIVHHLEELPGALAGLLRTWFAEVNS